MSIATVVTRGYGTFGSVNLLSTLGYGNYIAAVANSGYATKDIAEYTLPPRRPEFKMKHRQAEYTVAKR